MGFPGHTGHASPAALSQTVKIKSSGGELGAASEMYNQVNGTFTANDGTTTSVGAATPVSSKRPALGLLLRLPLAESLDVNLRVADVAVPLFERRKAGDFFRRHVLHGQPRLHPRP